jgi:nucleoside-diphosphate-sugar epimerase
MKVLITGTTGYIGHQLALEALKRGYTVHALVRDPASKFVPRHSNIILFTGDVTDRLSIEVAMYGCEKVIHCAAITKFSDRDKTIFYKVNVEGTRNMLDAALKARVKKFVFTSTGAVMGPSGKNPIKENDPRTTAFENDYEISKHWAEQLVKDYSHKGLFAVIVAAPRVYGPGLPANGNIFDSVLKNTLSRRLAFLPSNGNAVANYAYVDDVVKGHFLAMEKGLGGEKYTLGGENLSYRTFFQNVAQYASKKIRIIPVPSFLLKSWSFVYMFYSRLFGGNTQVSPRVISRLLQNRALNCEKAVSQLGYQITPFSEGIKKTILHLQNNPS